VLGPTECNGCIEIEDALPSGATQTYTLEPGPPSATVTNPIVTARNVTCGPAMCIQMSNGLTAIRKPAASSQTSGNHYDLAPLDSKHYYTFRFLLGSSSELVLSTGGQAVKLSSTGTACTSTPCANTQAVINSATGCSNGYLTSAPGRSTPAEVNPL
jgi:hypothetical protein